MSTTQATPTTEGTVPFIYDGETYETYYKVFGDLSDRTRTPLIGLHGGPGLVHNYLVPLADLTSASGTPVVLYDQLGNGRSTHVHDKPPTFWTVELFVAELQNLLTHLGAQESFDLLGHSWGGVLGAEFAVRTQSAGLKHLVLSNSLASFELWIQSVGGLLQSFPPEVQAGIGGAMSDTKKYREAILALHAVHGCTVKPPPEEYFYSLDASIGEGGDPTVAHAPLMVGWSIIDRLHLVRVPTLVLNGRKDISQDFVVALFFERIPRVKWVTFENSSHTPFFEERERYMQVVAGFLKLEA